MANALFLKGKTMARIEIRNTRARTRSYLQCKNCGHKSTLPSLILFALFVFCFLGIFIFAQGEDVGEEVALIINAFFIFIILFTLTNFKGISVWLFKEYPCPKCKNSDWVYVEKKVDEREDIEELKKQRIETTTEEQNDPPHRQPPRRQNIENPIGNEGGLREKVGAILLIILFVLFGLWVSGRLPAFLNFFSF